MYVDPVVFKLLVVALAATLGALVVAIVAGLWADPRYDAD